jgi:hypothetical protein
MGARTDVRFLLFPAVCEWFYHVLTAPHVLSGVPPFIILNFFSAARVAQCLAVAEGNRDAQVS